MTTGNGFDRGAIAGLSRRGRPWRLLGDERAAAPATVRRQGRWASGARNRPSQPSLALLGAPRLRIAGAWHDLPPSRWVALLAYVAHARTWVRREALAATFWPEHDQVRASWNLRQCLQTIARSRAGPAFEREPTRVCWRGTSDLGDFEAHLQAASWQSAVAAYRGPFLDGLEAVDVGPFQDWLGVERRDLEERWRAGVLALAEERLRADRGGAALDLAHTLLRHDPLDEVAVGLALRAAAASGDRTRGARTYRAFCEALRDELGAEPAPTIEKLWRDLTSLPT
ncbi:MAG: AfsR/SARP family transcriptional regulator [Trueperaceae bacterium]